MSLKPQRNVTQFTDVTKFCNFVSTRGGIVSLITLGSGAAYDQAQSQVAYTATSSGNRPYGFLMNDVVNIDLTRQHANRLRDEVQIGSKVTVLKKGFVVTNNIVGTPGVGDSAHLTSSGNIMPVTFTGSLTVNALANPKIGTFDSLLDEDGYAKVYVDL